MDRFIINSVTIFNFYAEMLLAILTITPALKRRNRFFLRAAAALAFSLAVWYAVMFLLPTTHFVYDYLRYFLLFLSALADIQFCFDVTLGSTLFCGAAAYAIQHLVCRTYGLLFYLPGILFNCWSVSWIDVPHFFAYWLILAALYFLLRRLLGRRLKISQLKFSAKSQAAIVAVLLAVTLFISATYDLSSENYINTFIFMFCDGLCAALLLIIQLHAYSLTQKELELAEIESLHRMELRQMRQTREMMEMINIKSHDLKHQLMAAGGRLNEEEAAEIARAVYAYDNSVHTGLESLDLVVTQKKMVCERAGISFTYMLDGTLLSFMSSAHIYSLVGNLLDNAIEAAERLPQDRRYIVFEVKRAANLVLLRTENEYEGTLRWSGSRPLTSKADTDSHGFGMKSMTAIVEKYGGTLSLSAKGGLFVATAAFTEK